MLRIRELSLSFGGHQKKITAVHDVSLSIGERSFTGIVGESGSGKTTWALSVMRLLPSVVAAGGIFWEMDGKEKNILSLSEDELRHMRGSQVSYVFQDPATSLNPLMRVGRQIAETYQAHFGSSRQIAERESLAQLGSVGFKEVPRVFHSFPHELSGGMKQRAMIAMALVAKPRLMIADEPTTALDISSQTEIMGLLRQLQKDRGLSVLFITHDLSLAEEYCDDIYVMNEGRLVEHAVRSPRGFEMKSAYGCQLTRASLMGLKPKTFIEV